MRQPVILEPGDEMKMILTLVNRVRTLSSPLTAFVLLTTALSGGFIWLMMHS